MTQENINVNKIFTPDPEPSGSSSPPNFKQIISNLFVPDHYQPEAKIALPTATTILTIPEPEIEVLRPDTETTAKLTENGKPELDKNLIFYLSSPLNYFDSLFKAKNLDSPIEEIKNQIETSKAELPTLSEASKILLKSPLEKIRKGEKARLIEEGISGKDIADYFLPETAFVDVSNLDFIQTLEKKSLIEFYDVLDRSIEELLIINDRNDEQIRHLAKFSEYLTILVESFLYKSSTFKIDNPMLLEKIAEKIEFLTENNLHGPSGEYLKTFFDFIAHFEMNNRDASIVFLNILKTNHLHHPLEHELTYQLHPESRTDQNQAKVGLEMEGIPLVLFGHLPDGFDSGKDSDFLPMPEIRRNDQFLPFDNQYRKQLFDLWYWAKMTRFKGASLHLHFDDQSGRKIFTFRNLFGSNESTVRENQKSGIMTAELRFNLSGYSYGGGIIKKVHLDLSAPFFHQQYDLVDFIELLLKIGADQNLKEIDSQIAELPTFWKTRAKKSLISKKEKEFLTVDQVMKLAKESNWSWRIIREAFAKLEGLLTADQVMKLAEESNWSWDVTKEALTKLEGLLTLDQVTKLTEKSNWNEDIVQEAFAKLEGLLTLDQVMKLTEKSNWNWNVAQKAFVKLEGSLTADQVIKLAKKSDWNWRAVPEIFAKLEGSLTANQVMKLAKKSGWDQNAILGTLAKLEGLLTADQVMKLVEKSNWYWQVTKGAFAKLEGLLTADQVTQLAEKSDWNRDVTREAFAKLEGLLTLNQVMKLAEKSDWDEDVVLEALAKLEGLLTLDQVMKLVKLSDYDRDIIRKAFAKLEGLLTLDQVMKLAKKSGWSWNIVREALAKLEGSLTADQIMKQAEEWNWSWRVIREAFAKLEGSLTADQVMQLAEELNWNWNIVREALIKLEGSLTADQIMKLATKSGWDHNVIRDSLVKLEGLLTADQVMKLAKKSGWDQSVIRDAFAKLEGLLTLNQVMKLTEESRWDQDIVLEAFAKLEPIENVQLFKNFILESLNKVSKEFRLMLWSSLMKIKLPQTFVLKQIFNDLEN
ncbi:MAG: hypothetical protein ABII10_02045 [Candidatus Paceibacterota bacterium]